MGNKSTKRERGIYKVTLQGSVVNLLLMIFKFVAGFLGRSSAMIADAVHSLTDFITDFIVIAFVRIASKPEDENHDFGHGKFETLATAIIGLFLLLVGVGIFWSGISDIYRVLFLGEFLASPSFIALLAAILSLLSKEVLYRYTVYKGKQLNSQAVIANAWHHRSDAWSSVGTTLGIGGAILLGQKWSLLDPAAAVVVSVLIVFEAIKMLRSCADELLERSLPQQVEDEIRQLVLSIEGIQQLEELRTRRIGSYYAMSFHIILDGQICLKKAHDYSILAEAKLRAHFGENTYINIHIEPDI